MQRVGPGIVMVLLRTLATACLVLFLVPGAGAQTPAERALAVYEEGKKLYDARDYAGARSKFIEAIKAEPGNARWHYNLGLTHRQMGNDQAARQSFLKARELDPNYKRAEIEQKLASMGFAGAAGGTDAATAADAAASPQDAAARALPPNPPPESTPVSDDEALSFVLWLVGGVFALIIGFIALVFWLVRRGASGVAAKARDARRGPVPDATAIDALRGRLDTAAARLVPVEHALRLGEHADVRSLLDHATRIEQAMRRQLDDAAAGDGHAFRKAGRAIDELEDAAGRASELATAAFGPQALSGSGERVACYFCARPLANADYRRPLSLKQGTSSTGVLACPPCAESSARGEAPAVTTGSDGHTHWSELPGFDPYAARHAASEGTRRIPAWKFAPQRPLGELAVLAGGAALAGGALAALLRPGAAHGSDAPPLLDLDAARESGLAQEAARAAAERAGASRQERFSDHS